MGNAFEIASVTDPGLVRNFNEDYLLTDEGLGLMVLADGMGGYKGGDVASRIAARLIADHLKAIRQSRNAAAYRSDGLSSALNDIKLAMINANLTILQAKQSNPEYRDMGTTVVAALFHEDRVAIAHIGDSRLYRLRDNQLTQLTSDHSAVQEQVKRGLIGFADAKVSHNRNLVTRALGIDPKVEIELREEEVLPDDIYLLCSDGLNDLVSDSDIELAVKLLKVNLQLAANQLVNMANDNGGHDNISVILTKVYKPFPKKPGLLHSIAGWFK